MQRILAIIAFAMMMFFPVAHAGTAPQTANQVKQELVQKLVADGYMTAASAAEATTKYVKEDVAVAAEESWTRWLSWVNLLKVVAVILFLIAFSGVIVKIGKGLWGLITAIPTYVYQGVFLLATATATIQPALQPMAQGFYFALFGAFANLIIIGWIIQTYPQVQAFLKKLFSLGIPEYVIASAWATAYFGALALTYDSQVFGFFAVAAFSGMFGFGLYYMPGVLFLSTKEGAIQALVWSHTILLVAYGIALQTVTIPHLSLFQGGIEYYCTIALGVAFLITTTPFGRGDTFAKAIIPLIICTVLANYGYAVYDMHAIGAVFDVFLVLIALEWIMYAAWSGGLIIGTFVSGILLFSASLFFERHGHAVMLALGVK